METIEIGIKRFEVKYTEDLVKVINNFLLEEGIIKIINLDIDRSYSFVIGTLIYEK